MSYYRREWKIECKNVIKHQNFLKLKLYWGKLSLEDLLHNSLN